MKAGMIIISVALMLLPYGAATAKAQARADLAKNSVNVKQEDQAAKESRRQEEAETSFRQMCEFIELDETQVEQARQVFDSRMKEMGEILRSARDGGLSQDEVRARMTESFKKHRERFESLLNEKQRERLVQWETPKVHERRKGRRS